MKKRVSRKKKISVGDFFKENPGIIVVGIIALIIFIFLARIISPLIGFIVAFVLFFIYCLPSLYRLITHKPKKKRTKAQKRLFWQRVLIGFFSFCIVGFVAVIVFFAMIVKNAPDFDPELLYKSDATVLYSSDGTIFAKLGLQNRETIAYEDMSESLINAIIATEDARFFQHNGFDAARFLVASIKQLLGNSDAGGASTLTMQVVKNTYTSTVDTGWEGIVRKFTDIYMSIFKVEQSYTKEEIIEFYANSYYLGGGAYGVEQASQTYFNKSASELSIPEAALIAGLFNAPSYLDPYNYPERAENRRQTVLYLLKRHGYITDEEYEIALDITVEDMLVPKTSENEYQGLINTVVSEINKKFGQNVDPYSTPMEIYTTFDLEKQDYIDQVMSGETWDWENDVVQAGIMVLDTQTGAMVAVGAGRNESMYNAKSQNFAIDTIKQIGSTAKPLYDYAPAIEYENWSPATPIVDEEYTYSDGTKINNADRTYMGLITARTALAHSRNIPALKTFQSVNNKDIYEFVTKLGLSPEVSNNKIHEAHAIGGYTGESPMTLAAAYAAFGNGGYYNEPYCVTKVVYRNTDETWEYKAKPTRAMSEETAYIMYDMLIDSGKTGMGRYYNINGVTYGAKTGTTNYDSATIAAHPNWPSNPINDSWLAAVNSQYTVGLWYGYDKIYDDYVNTYGKIMNVKLFNAVAKGIYTEKTSIEKPDDVIEVEIEKETYPIKLASENTPSNLRSTELFKTGTEPTEVSERFADLDNPTNLKTTYEDGKITISWEPIDTPYSLSTDAINELANSLYKSSSYKNSFIQNRNNYNKNYMGTVGYNVYTEIDGSLTLIGFTTNTSINYNVTSTDENINFVIKATYSIFKSAESLGAQVTHTFNGESAIIQSRLNGESEITLAIGDSFVDEGVKVLENNQDITDKVSIKKTIYNSNNQVISAITTDKADTFTITYSISYESYRANLTRKITVK